MERTLDVWPEPADGGPQLLRARSGGQPQHQCSARAHVEQLASGRKGTDRTQTLVYDFTLIS